MDIVYDLKTKQVINYYNTSGDIAALQNGAVSGAQVASDMHARNLKPDACATWYWITGEEKRRIPRDFFQDCRNYKVVIDPIRKECIGLSKNNQIVVVKQQKRISADIPIVWHGYFLNSISYSLINRKFAFGLKERGLNMNIVPLVQLRENLEIPKADQELIRELSLSPQQVHARDTISVFCHLPIARTAPALYNIAYTMMETQTLKPSLVNTINSSYNEAWFPCKFNRQQFLHGGFQGHSSHMPLGFDEEKFQVGLPKELPNLRYEICNPKPERFSDKPQGYVFLAVYRFSYRKGPDVLLKAFRRAFKASDNVSLVMFSRHYWGSNDETNNMCREHIKKWMEEDENSAPVYWCHDYLPDDDVPALYGGSDCFISTSRGEGFGLPPIEAAACGLPIIAPDHSGFGDYMNNERGYVIPSLDGLENCGGISVINGKPQYMGDNPEWAVWVTNAFQGQMFPKFGEQTINATADLMRHVYANQSEAQAKAGKMRQFVLDNFTWDHCITRIEDRLREILQDVLR